jgi:hypothetical protein
MECWTGVLFSCACMDSSTPEAGITWETRFFPLRTWETNAVFPPSQVETKTFPSPLCMLLFPPMLHGLHRSLLPSRAIPSRNLVQLGSINFFSQSKSLSIQVHIYSYHQSSVVSTSNLGHLTLQKNASGTCLKNTSLSFYRIKRNIGRKGTRSGGPS